MVSSMKRQPKIGRRIERMKRGEVLFARDLKELVGQLDRYLTMSRFSRQRARFAFKRKSKLR